MKTNVTSIRNILEGFESYKLIFIYDKYYQLGNFLFQSIFSKYCQLVNRKKFIISEDKFYDKLFETGEFVPFNKCQ